MSLDLDVNYTFEDYADATTAHERQGESLASRIRHLFVGALLMGFAGLFVASLLSHDANNSTGRRSGPLDTFIRVGPWSLIMIGAIGLAVLSSRSRRTGATSRTKSFLYASAQAAREETSNGRTVRPPIWSRQALRAVIYVGVSLLFIVAILLANTGSRGDRPGLLRNLLPLAVAMGTVVYLLFRSTLRRQWQMSADLHLPQNVRVDPDTFAVANGRGGSHYRWETIERVVEAPRAFLIYPPTGRFIFLPKRVFANGASIDWFRELLREKVANRSASPGFEVIPMAKKAD